MTEYYMLGFLTRKDGVRNDRVLYVRIFRLQRVGDEAGPLQKSWRRGEKRIKILLK